MGASLVQPQWLSHTLSMPYPGRPSSHSIDPQFVGTAEVGRYIDPTVRDFIVAEYQAGRSLRELAEITGRTHGAVRNVLDRAGVQRRGRGAPRLRG